MNARSAVPFPDRPEPADVYVFSFPKCGRTWLRVLLAKAISNARGLPIELCSGLRLTEFSRVDPAIPTVVFWHDDQPGWRRAEELSGDKSDYRASKVVFLTRDLRDVLVSYYFQRTRRVDNPFAGTLDEFIVEPRGGLSTCIEYWNIWHAARGIPRSFLLVSYEELARDTRGVLAKVVDFCGMPFGDDDAVFADAVEYGLFENMRALELADAFRSEKLRPGDPADPESFKTRRGVVGGFRDYLTALQQRRADELIRSELVADWQPLAFAADVPQRVLRTSRPRQRASGTARRTGTHSRT